MHVQLKYAIRPEMPSRHEEAIGAGIWVPDSRDPERGRPLYTFHDLRHTFASLLLHFTGDLAYVAEQLGHSGLEMLSRVYAHTLKEVRKASGLTGRPLLPGSPVPTELSRQWLKGSRYRYRRVRSFRGFPGHPSARLTWSSG